LCHGSSFSKQFIVDIEKKRKLFFECDPQLASTLCGTITTLLGVQAYTSVDHFIHEVLQNGNNTVQEEDVFVTYLFEFHKADDTQHSVAIAKGEVPTLTLQSFANGCVISNNENGFSRDDVEAITSVDSMLASALVQ
jgi:hypothetical protein